MGSNYTASLSDVVEHFLNEDTYAFVFANARRLTTALAKSLEEKLDEEGNECDVVHLHGKLEKEEKFHLSNLFCQKTTLSDYDPRVLIATSTSDHGVDHPDAQLVVNMEWTDSIPTFVQQKGRSSRNGQRTIMKLIAAVSSYIMLIRRIMQHGDVQATDDDVDETSNLSALNMAFQPALERNNALDAIARDYQLQPHEKRRLMIRQLCNLYDVL